ncbi:MAG: GNAT family N-acetyltransferase [Alphaproteobacteria bacterium]|nr:GNAT family N-acetyltransferase [Alphaproteobacteria bacterium]HCP01088.1 GNAT family N-acetyltransferase [Rhodospirillaceae bacterium]
MDDDETAFSARVVENIATIPPDTWARLAGDSNPFVSYPFLLALEETSCASNEAGWLARHLVVEESSGDIIAAAPAYLKSHSQGEYVFDHAWASAWERAGGRYYPKMQVAAPFSPVSGPRLLAGNGPVSKESRLVLLRALETVCQKLDLSSVHVTFCTKHDYEVMGVAGWVQRIGRQFHWYNRDYTKFDDFLAALTSRKRKMIRRERHQVADQGISVSPLSGDDIKSHHWDAFYRFYVDTYDRKWGYPYLTREFFEALQDRMGESIVLIMATMEELPVAGALNLRGATALYGRNWGCLGDYRFLHFEACYYQAIEFAIDNGLKTVEAGTQGPHKIQRGYEPVQTYSGHYIPNESFREAVERFCREEEREVEWELKKYSDHLPYRQAD